jgi:hypothetical protein
MEKVSAPNLVPCEPRTGGPAWRAAEAEGFDMSLIVETLRMPVAERLRQHDLALTSALSLRQAFIEQHGGIGKTDRATH